MIDRTLDAVPEHAVRTEKCYHVIPAEHPFSGHGVEISVNGLGQEIVTTFGGRVDITAEYQDWLSTLPVRRSVTFDWEEAVV